MNNRDMVLTAIGKYYGYPKCCITYFNSRLPFDKLTKDQDAVHNGKGFIPCPSCASYIQENGLSVKELIRGRKCKEDYPNDGSMDAMTLFVLKNINHSPMVH